MWSINMYDFIVKIFPSRHPVSRNTLPSPTLIHTHTHDLSNFLSSELGEGKEKRTQSNLLHDTDHFKLFWIKWSPLNLHKNRRRRTAKVAIQIWNIASTNHKLRSISAPSPPSGIWLRVWAPGWGRLFFCCEEEWNRITFLCGHFSWRRTRVFWR